jgi:RimJ/RimL family protein N-acetyltransferase
MKTRTNGRHLTMLQDNDLRLRPARVPEDAAAAVPWYGDPEVLDGSEGEGTPPYDLDIVTRMFRYLADHGELYMIEIQGGDSWIPIGDAALLPDSVPIVIGDARYRSRGLGRRVLRLLIARAVALGRREITAGKVFTYNERSLRLFEGAGFVRQELATPADAPASWRLVLDLTRQPPSPTWA